MIFLLNVLIDNFFVVNFVDEKDYIFFLSIDKLTKKKLATFLDML